MFLSLTIYWITLVRLKVANTACSVFSLHMPDPGNVEMIPFYIRGSRIEVDTMSGCAFGLMRS